MLLKLLTSVDLAIERRRSDQRKKHKNGSAKRFGDGQYASSYGSGSSSSSSSSSGGGGGKDPTKFSSAAVMELLAPLDGASAVAAAAASSAAGSSSGSAIDLTTTTKTSTSYITTNDVHTASGQRLGSTSGMAAAPTWQHYHFSPVRTPEVDH